MTTYRGKRGIVIVLAAVVAAALALPVFPAQASSPAADREQLIYEINRARFNPNAFKARAADITMPSNIKAAPPLALNTRLTSSATLKANEIANNNYFAHKSAVTGKHPNQIVREAGYTLPAHWSNTANNVESLHSGNPNAFRVLVSFANSPSHRVHIFGESDFFRQHREIGVGRSSSKNVWAVHTAPPPGSPVFVTGAAYRDANNNGFMDPGEALSGVTIKVGSATTTTGAGGFYTLKVNQGTHTVTASGGGLGSTQSASVTVANQNVWVDFVSNGVPIVRTVNGNGQTSQTTGSATASPSGTSSNSSSQANTPAGSTSSPRFSATTERLTGSNPAAAAVEVSKKANPHGATVVYLIPETFSPLAIGAGPAAAAENAPILVVGNNLPQVTRNELARLRPNEVVVVGNAKSISASVLAEVRSAVPSAKVTRVTGSNRIAAVANLTARAFTPSQVDTVYVTHGRIFPFGMAAAQAAVTDGSPLLLSKTGNVPTTTKRELNRLKPQNIVVIGDGINAATYRELGRYASSIERVSAKNAFALSARLAKETTSGTSKTVYVSVGRSYPQAVFGSALVRSDSGPVLFVKRNIVPKAVEQELNRLKPTTVVFLTPPNLPTLQVVNRFG